MEERKLYHGIKVSIQKRTPRLGGMQLPGGLVKTENALAFGLENDVIQVGLALETRFCPLDPGNSPLNSGAV